MPVLSLNGVKQRMSSGQVRLGMRSYGGTAKGSALDGLRQRVCSAAVKMLEMKGLKKQCDKAKKEEQELVWRLTDAKKERVAA